MVINENICRDWPLLVKKASSVVQERSNQWIMWQTLLRTSDLYMCGSGIKRLVDGCPGGKVVFILLQYLNKTVGQAWAFVFIFPSCR